MKKIFYISIFFFLMANICFAKVQLEMSVLVKKGLESGLVLTSEIHQVLLLSDTEMGQLRLKNGSKVDIGVQFLQDPKDYGPSSLVLLKGTIKNFQGKVLGNLGDTNSILHLGEVKTFLFREKTGQLIEVIVRPTIL